MNIYDIVLEGSYTTNQIRRRSKLLKTYYQDQVFRSKNFSENNFQIEDINWFNQLDKSLFSEINNNNFTEIFAELDKQIAAVSPVTIYIAFDLPTNELNKMGAWLRQNINPKMVFDVKADYDLIGGCRLVSRGISKDYSLKAQIEAKKDTILASFNSAFK